jgi:hypothetical protein
MQRELAVDAAPEGLLPWTLKLTRITSLPWPASMVVGPPVLLILTTSLVPLRMAGSSPRLM